MRLCRATFKQTCVMIKPLLTHFKKRVSRSYSLLYFHFMIYPFTDGRQFDVILTRYTWVATSGRGGLVIYFLQPTCVARHDSLFLCHDEIVMCVPRTPRSRWCLSWLKSRSSVHVGSMQKQTTPTCACLLATLPGPSGLPTSGFTPVLGEKRFSRRTSRTF